MKKFKVLAAAAALMMCVSGCSKPSVEAAVVDEATAPKPATAEELLSLSKESYAGVSNGRLSGNILLDISATIDEESMSIPIELGYVVDWSNTNKARIQAEINADMPEEEGYGDVNETVDAYVAYSDLSVDVWYKTSQSSEWFFESSEIPEEESASAKDKFGSFDISGDLSENEKGYVIVQTFKSIFESDAYKSAIADLTQPKNTAGEDDVDSYMSYNFDVNEILSSLGTSFADIESQLGKAKLEYVFDEKTFRLTEVNLTDLVYTLDIPDMAVISVSLSSSNIISDYNELSESDYTVPEDVANSVLNTSEDDSIEVFETRRDETEY